MIALDEPSEGISAALVTTVRVCVPVVPEEVPTLSAVEPVRLPTVAVTVIDVPFATPEAVIVVVALPVVPVTAFALARAPPVVVSH